MEFKIQNKTIQKSPRKQEDFGGGEGDTGQVEGLEEILTRLH